MSGLERERAARKTAISVPFATMRADALLVAACVLSANAFRVVWLANAGWKPGEKGLTDGRVVLSYSMIRHPNSKTRAARMNGTGPAAAPSPGSQSVTSGIKEAIAGNWLTLRTPGTRRCQQGGARGNAAEYGVPHRHGADAPRVEMPPDVRRPEGKVRLNAERMRHDAADLTAQELRVLGYIIAFQDRDTNGALVTDAPFALRLTLLQRHLGLGRATVSGILKQLKAKGRLTVTHEHQGRQSTLYRLPKPYELFRRLDPVGF